MEQARAATRLVWQRTRRSTVGYEDAAGDPTPLPPVSIRPHAPRRRRRCREIRAIDPNTIAQLSAHYAGATRGEARSESAAIRLWRRLIARS